MSASSDEESIPLLSDLFAGEHDDADADSRRPSTPVPERSATFQRAFIIEIPSLEERLLAAVEDGDVAEVKSLLAEGADANVVAANSSLNCAQLAARSGHPLVLRALLEHGAAAQPGRSLVHLAVQGRNLECLTLALHLSPDVDAEDAKKETPLYSAVRLGWLAGVETLLDRDAEVGRRHAVNGKTVLQLAVGHADVADADRAGIVRAILEAARSHREEEYKAIVDVVDATGVPPLFVAALKGNLPALLALLAAGATATGVDFLGRTVLHCAVETKRADVLEALFERRPQDVRPLVDQRGGRLDATPLHLAVNRGDLASVKYLMEVGGASLLLTVKMTDHGACNVLHLAALKHNVEVVAYFACALRTSADLRSLVAQPTGADESALKLAMVRRQLDFVMALIGAGADLAECGIDQAKPSRSVVDILIHQVPSAVDILLSTIMDGAIRSSRNTTSVTVDYSVLLSNADAKKTSTDSFRVLRALLDTGDSLGQERLYEHPLIESFLLLHWRRLQGPYWVLLTLQACYALSLSLLVLCLILQLGDTATWTLTATTWLVMAPLVVHEVECCFDEQPPKYRVLALARVLCFSTAVWQGVPDAPRESGAVGVLLAWFELVMLISRVPDRGFYMLLFLEVAKKYVQLLMLFMFVLFAFLVAFMATALGRTEPFVTFPSAVIKTVVMVTGEFEFDAINERLHGVQDSTHLAQFTAMLVFVLFVVFVGLVLTNLFVAVAVIDVKKMRVVSKQTEALSLFEKFLLAPPPWPGARRGVMALAFAGVCFVLVRFRPKRVRAWQSYAEVRSSYSIDVLLSDSVAVFPRELASAIIVKGYENKQRRADMYKEAEEFRRRKAAEIAEAEREESERARLGERRAQRAHHKEEAEAARQEMRDALAAVREEIHRDMAELSYRLCARVADLLDRGERRSQGREGEGEGTRVLGHEQFARPP